MQQTIEVLEKLIDAINEIKCKLITDNKPKDYQILHFKNINEDLLVELHPNGMYRCKSATGYNGIGTLTLDYCLGLECLVIYSVKRLSDNQVFTIEQKTSGNNIIKKFKVDAMTMDLIVYMNSGGFANWPTNLASLTLQKEKLFTTVDGVDILEGDEFWAIIIQDNKWSYVLLQQGVAGAKYKDEYTLQRVFSTKEKAETALKEHHLFTTPILSLNDLLDAWAIISTVDREDMKEIPLFIKFKELAQQKLNK